MRYVALLRGINVGGATQIKMDVLTAVFEELGFENVKTYINSGNVGFDSERASEKGLVKDIEAAIAATFGKQVDVIARRQAAVREVVSSNPFAGEFESHKQMHVLFLRTELPLEKQFQLSETNFGSDAVICLGREIYVLLGGGMADSVFGKRSVLDKKPRVIYTARNWRTVQKLAEL
ncbi:MAG: DUF1697 domain-containing protein [Pyrinomonadaceae bacterium]